MKTIKFENPITENDKLSIEICIGVDKEGDKIWVNLADLYPPICEAILKIYEGRYHYEVVK